MRKSEDIFAVVVVYNKKCDDSETCKALSLLEKGIVNVIVYDNCDKSTGYKACNEEYCKAREWRYLTSGKNVGLSKAYNACIDLILMETMQGTICLFDDDTHIEDKYFKALTTEKCEGKGDIFVPFVYSKGRLLSPSYITPNYLTKRINRVEQIMSIDSRKLTAINSGMAIDLSVFHNYRYDEEIFLDGVDHNFLKDMVSNGRRLKIISYNCNHEFSGDNKPDLSSALYRFQIFTSDYKHILKNNRIAYLVLAGKRAMRLAMQYKIVSV